MKLNKLQSIDFKYYKSPENAAVKQLCIFNKDIKDIEIRKSLFKKIKDSNIREKVWALFGSNENEERWICLQVGGSQNIINEIVADIKAMLPLNEDDKKYWSSEFHSNIFEVHYGLDVRCQKYRNMFENFDRFCVVLIDSQKYLEGINYLSEIDKLDKLDKYAEVVYAYETKALYWNPFGGEYHILTHIKELAAKHNKNHPRLF